MLLGSRADFQIGIALLAGCGVIDTFDLLFYAIFHGVQCERHRVPETNINDNLAVFACGLTLLIWIVTNFVPIPGRKHEIQQ